MDRITSLVRAFETGELPTSEFHHAQHLTVALWYLSRFPFDEAAARFRKTVKGYIGHHAVDPSKYHETITMFWLHIVDSFMAGRDASADLESMAADLVATWGSSKAIASYYSKDLLDSAEARASFVAPDLQPLP